MKAKVVLSWILLALLGGSCVKDHSNYDYTPLNDVTISGIDASYAAIMQDSLKVHPQISRELQEREDDLEFLWIMYEPGKTYYEADTLAKTRNLDIIVNAIPGTYTVSYHVIDKNTGVNYRSEFKVVITSEFQRGFLALSELDGHANVTFIGVTGKAYPDIYYNINQEYAGTNPVAIRYTGRSPLDYVMIVCDDARGGVVLSSTSFKYLSDFSEFFYDGLPTPYAPQALEITESYPATMEYYGIYTQMYFTNGGRLQMRDVNYTVTLPDGEKPTVEVLFYQEFPGDYEISPVSFRQSAREMFYDEKYKRFMYIPNKAASNFYATTATATTPFDPTNVGMTLVYGRPAISPRNYYYCNSIFKDSDNNYWYLKFNLTSATSITPLKKTAIPADAEIINAKTFTGNATDDYLYFAADSKVYVYDCNLNQERLLYDFADLLGAGVVVDNILWHEAVLKTAKVMFVCASKPGETGKCGSIFEMEVLSTSMNVRAEYRNVCGHVVSTHWQNGAN
jgi:hypothetical protein